MKKLSSNFIFDSGLDKKILELSKEFEERKTDDPKNLRDKVLSNFKIDRLAPNTNKTKNGIKILSVDSSTAQNEMRYSALWGIHCVTLYARFDGSLYKDPMLGGDNIIYTDIMYDSFVDVKNIKPYRRIASRSNSMRILTEYNSVINSYYDIKSNGISPDYILIDGSLYTTVKALERNSLIENYPGYNSALEAGERLLKTGKVIGMIEDSHSTDISRKLGMDMTNLMLFEIALGQNEYIVDAKEGVNICYIKLPEKKLGYLPSHKSKPVVVRWEFSYPNFKEDLEGLAALWCMEADLLHPQLYPLRIADYLTRRIKVGGILEKFIRDKGLDLKYREMREA